MHRKLAMAWNSWAAWYADMMEQRRRLAGALARMLNRKLSMAWEQWQAHQKQPTYISHTLIVALH